MGGFYVACIFLGIISKRFSDAGLKDIFIESDLFGGNSADQLLRAFTDKKLAREARPLQESEDGAAKSSSHGKNVQGRAAESSSHHRRSKGKKVKGSKHDLASTKGKFIQIPSSPSKKADDKDEITTKLTKKQSRARENLYGLHPDVDKVELDKILESKSYNVNAASELIQLRSGEKDLEWEKVPSRQRKKPNDSPSPTCLPTNAGFEIRKPEKASQAENGPDDQDQYFARYNTSKGLEHTDVEQINREQLRLIERNKDYLKEQKIIDLHGQHAYNAVCALHNFLVNAAKIKHSEVTVITGIGNHSKYHISTVRKGVINYLKENNYGYRHPGTNHGAFIIQIPRKKSKRMSR